MNSILVPIDGSESSLNALRAAIALNRERSNAQLHVISVQPPITSGNVKRFISAEILDDYYQEEGEKSLSSARKLLAEDSVDAQVKVLVGPVAESIAQYAKQHECNHLVMGTRGLGRVAGLVLGSVATKVISLTDVPVTLVK